MIRPKQHGMRSGIQAVPHNQASLQQIIIDRQLGQSDVGAIV